MAHMNSKEGQIGQKNMCHSSFRIPFRSLGGGTKKTLIQRQDYISEENLAPKQRL